MPEQRLQRTRDAYYVEAEEGRTLRVGDRLKITIPVTPVQPTSAAYRITQAQLANDLHAGEE